MSIWGKFLGWASIRIFFPVVGALSIILLLATCILGYSLQTIYSNWVAVARENAQIGDAANDLRHSSGDLTRLARLYVITGDPAYRNDYQAVESIRNGVTPRPHNYEHIYWDLLPQYRDERHPPSQTQSLPLRWQQLPLEESERQLLQESLDNSQLLISKEQEAIAIVFAAGEEDADAARRRAIKILFSLEYQKAKHNIMLPLDIFLSSLEDRYQNKAAEIRRNAENILFIFVSVLVMFLLLMALMVLFVHHKVLSPVRHMIGNIRRIREGVDIERRVFYPDEIGMLMRQFYSMKEQMDRSFQELEAVSFTDSLTGLYNRHYFNQVAKKQMLLALRNRHPMCLLMCDIDHFKPVNDQYGHLSGDNALRHVATLIAGSVRESDICARFGGEEFLLLLSNTAAENGLAVAEKIRAALENAPCDVGEGVTLNLTISIGVAEMQGSDNINDIIDLADKALYEAKNGGRNQVRLG